MIGGREITVTLAIDALTAGHPGLARPLPPLYRVKA
jgi:hypothetical protein